MWCKTSDLTKKKRQEGRERGGFFFALINVIRSTGNPRKERERERATSPLWIEDQAAGWRVPRDLLKWNS